MDAITSQTEPTRVHRAYGGEELRYPSGGRIVFATRRSTMRARGTAFDVVVLTIRTWENTQARADIAPLIQTSKHGRIVIASEL